MPIAISLLATCSHAGRRRAGHRAAPTRRAIGIHGESVRGDLARERCNSSAPTAAGASNTRNGRRSPSLTPVNSAGGAMATLLAIRHARLLARTARHVLAMPAVEQRVSEQICCRRSSCRGHYPRPSLLDAFPRANNEPACSRTPPPDDGHAVRQRHDGATDAHAAADRPRAEERAAEVLKLSSRSPLATRTLFAAEAAGRAQC